MSTPTTAEQRDAAHAAMIAATHWGAAGLPDAMRRLPGENHNYLCDVGVLKISIEGQADPELEEAVAATLAAANLPVPICKPSLLGKILVAVDLHDRPATARMQALLPGLPWRESQATHTLLRNIGSMVARAHRALKSFDHPRSDRSHQWDLERAGQHRAAVGHVPNQSLRRAIEWALHLHASCDITSCPRGMLHGDANDENILVDGDHITGFLDFGDCLRGPLVIDLAITLAYAVQHEGVGLEDAAAVVAGYDKIRKLDTTEQQALFPLMVARLATSACISATRSATDPDHSTWFSHRHSTEETLMALVDVAPRDAQVALCSTCAIRPECSPDTSARVDHRTTTHTGSLAARRARSLLGTGVLSLSYESPLHIVRGQGQFLYADDGRAYLDLVNNVCHVGHAHPRVVQALSTQAAMLNTNTRYLHKTIVEYAERLSATLPDGLDVCCFVNSGSEANELALRMARAVTGRDDIIVIDSAYHGSTGACIEMSPYKFNGPGGQGQRDWVHVVPMPDTYRGEITGDGAGVAYAKDVERVIGEATSSGRSIAAFLAESLLSCGGQIPLADGYLSAAFKHVRAAGGVCIADEVQVGLGRVGEAMWGFELHGVVPDIVVMGKPMGNGHPLAAVVTTRAIAEAFNTGMEFFSTFGGNPVSAAAGMAVLDVIEEEKLQARAATLGRRFMDGLAELRERHTIIGDVRGCGLFLGIELVRDRKTLEPADTEAAMIVNAMKQRGVLLSTDGPLRNVIKIKPPMVVVENDVDMAIRLLDDVLQYHGR